VSLAKQFSAIAREAALVFSLNGKLVQPDEVFTETGLLPAIVRRADQLCSLCLGHGLGVRFDTAEQALLGVNVVFEEGTPNLLRLLCMTDVLYEIARMATDASGSVTLDELMYD